MNGLVNVEPYNGQDVPIENVYVPLTSHRSIIEQLTKDFEDEKQAAIHNIIQNENIARARDFKMAKEIIELHKVLREKEALMNRNCRRFRYKYRLKHERLVEAEETIRKLKEENARLETKCQLANDHRPSYERLYEKDVSIREFKKKEKKSRLKLDSDILNESFACNLLVGDHLFTIDYLNQQPVILSEERLVLNQTVMNEPQRLEPKKDVNRETKIAREREPYLKKFNKLVADVEKTNDLCKHIASRMEFLEIGSARPSGLPVSDKPKVFPEYLDTFTASATDANYDEDVSQAESIISDNSLIDNLNDIMSTECKQREASTQTLKQVYTNLVYNAVLRGYVNFTSCNTGDIVFIMWDHTHRSFMIIQKSETLFFLNLDCIKELDLSCMGTDGLPIKLFATGEVVNKRLCLAQEDEIGFKIRKGTKFYRVEVMPYLASRFVNDV